MLWPFFLSMPSSFSVCSLLLGHTYSPSMTPELRPWTHLPRPWHSPPITPTALTSLSRVMLGTLCQALRSMRVTKAIPIREVGAPESAGTTLSSYVSMLTPWAQDCTSRAMDTPQKDSEKTQFRCQPGSSQTGRPKQQRCLCCNASPSLVLLTKAILE